MLVLPFTQALIENTLKKFLLTFNFVAISYKYE